jgi:hypothetical protein
MPALANPRHERFAQELAKGKSATEAYSEAGYQESRASASRLLTNANVQARVAELQERAAANVVISREWVLEQLIDNAAQAKQQGDIGPSNQALQLIGKEIGMLAVLRYNRDTLSPAKFQESAIEFDFVALDHKYPFNPLLEKSYEKAKAADHFGG